MKKILRKSREEEVEFFVFYYGRCIQYPVIRNSDRVFWNTLQRFCGRFSLDRLLSLHHDYSGCCLRYQRLATAHYHHWSSWDFFCGRFFVSTKFSLRAGSRWSTSSSGVAVIPPHRFALRRSHAWLNSEKCCGTLRVYPLRHDLARNVMKSLFFGFQY